jgi:hypothetical protein
MSKTHIMTCGGTKIWWDEANKVMSYTSDFTVLADGAPQAYGPPGCDPPPLDYLENAGYEGNWWGLSCNSNGKPYVQKEGDLHKWPFPSLYISCTAYEHSAFGKDDCRRFVDAATVFAAVIPGNVRNAVEPKFLGCKCRVIDKKYDIAIENVVCSDIGPSHHAGEGSIALAKEFKINADPKKGGSSDKKRWEWEFFPGIPCLGYQLQ